MDRPSHSWDTAISKFDVENSRSSSWVRSKLKVTTWVQHSVDSYPFRSMSVGHPIPEFWLFQNLTLKIKVMGEVTVQNHNVGLTSYRLTSLSFHVKRPSHSWDAAFVKLDLENPGLHNYRSRQLNGINPCSISEIWVPQSLVQMLPDLTSFWHMDKPIWGK